jgi:hypothetical protein
MQNTYGFIVKGYPDGTRREDQINLATASEADLFFSCFLGDVDLKLNGISFATRFGWVATLSFAFDFAQRVASLPKSSRSVVEFQEAEQWISLLSENDRVYVACSYAKGIASVPYTELWELVRGGLARYIEGLSSSHPGLVQNSALQQQLLLIE